MRRSAKFDVVFLDSGLRVTRGDRQELRIYARDEEAGAELGPAGRPTTPVTWDADSESDA